MSKEKYLELLESIEYHIKSRIRITTNEYPEDYEFSHEHIISDVAYALNCAGIEVAE